MSKITTIKELEKTLIKWDDWRVHRPLICHKFTDALYHLVTFVSITLQSYSTYSGSDRSHVSQLNEKIKKEKSDVSIFSMWNDIVSSHIVPELYSFSLVGAWGILEEFLRDVLFWSITNNLGTTKPSKYVKVKKTEIDVKKLTALTLELTRQNINELAKFYKNIFGIDLKTNKDFMALLNLRQRRNKIAHTGKLFGYNSITRELISSRDDFEEYLWSIQRRAGEEFKDVQKIYDKNNNPILHMTWHSYDPVETITSKELEEDFCSTIVHMWKLQDFLTEKLFLKTRKL